MRRLKSGVSYNDLFRFVCAAACYFSSLEELSLKKIVGLFFSVNSNGYHHVQPRPLF